MNTRIWAVIAVASLAFAGGCGDGRDKFNVAKTTGTVVCQGKPVPFVTIYFEPLQKDEKAIEAGKQGIAYADESGKFVVSTYDQNDGAVVGKHRVRVGRPLGENAKGFKCECGLDEEVDLMEAEIVAGKENVFELKLKLPSEMPASSAKKQQEAMEEEEDD